MDPDPEKEIEVDTALLRRIAQGDRQSFAEFYDRVSGLMFSTAYRVLNNQQAAEDVLQDVFVHIWEKAPLYDSSRGKPLTWVTILTRNKAIDRLRSIQRRNRLSDSVQEEAKTLDQFDDHSSFDAVAGAETSKLLRTAIRDLPEEQRVPIELAFLHSLTQTEIAERLKEPLGTVKARIRRGLLKLRETIGPRL